MKFARDPDHEAGEELDETGWKYLHGDAFRWVAPRRACRIRESACGCVRAC